ncbi:MAG: ATP-binding protein [Bacilli bacterium]
MIDLLSLEPQRISRDLKGKYILLYGLPGVGKTSLASEFKNVLIAGFEMGTNALNNVYVQPIKTWKDWRDMVKQLCTKDALKDKFDSIAIDTADFAWDLCVKWICSQNGVEKLGDIPWGGGYDLAKKEYTQTFRDLTYSGYGLVFISHSTEKTYKNEKGEDYTQIVPALPNRPFDIVNKMVDIIAYIREIPVEIGDKIENKRYMFLRGDQRFLAKSRFKYIKPRIELSYQGLVDAIFDAIDEEVAHTGGTASNEENPYTKQNFEEIMEDAKQLWGQVVQNNKTEQALAILEEEFGKPTRFSEILPEQTKELNAALIKIRDLV